MVNVRCHCGKIICQLENVPVPDSVVNLRPEGVCRSDGHTPGIVILCRHCRSYVVIRTSELLAISTREAEPSFPRRDLATR